MSTTKQTSQAHTIKQVVGGSSILIDAKLDNSQTMVKLCKNGNAWLSPTGWSNTEKSTLLDSQVEGDLTAISVPENFAADIQNGDRLTLRINSANFNEAFVWRSRSDDAQVDTSTEKRGLFSRFGSALKSEGDAQSEVEKRAREAREAAAASSAELDRAHEAKRAAEERALEAARLAEVANKLEQERIEAAKEAEKALIKAEAARLAEEKRIEAERLAEQARIAEDARLAEIARLAEEVKREKARRAEEARLAEEAALAEVARKAEEAKREKARLAEVARKAEAARLAEIARRETAVTKLDAKRRANIKELKAKREETRAQIAEQEAKVIKLAEQAKKAKTAVSSQSDLEVQAQRTFESAQKRLTEGEVNFTQCQKIEQSIQDELSQVERTLNEQQKRAAKASHIAQKAQNQYADADAAAKAAVQKAQELQAAAHSAQDEAKSLERAVSKYKQQAEDLSAQKTSTLDASARAREALDAIKTTLGSAKSSFEQTQERNAEAGNAMREADGLIQVSQSELAQIKALEDRIRTEEKRLKAQEITPENVDDIADLVAPKLDLSSLEVSAKTGVQKDKKIAALSSGFGARGLGASLDSANIVDAAPENELPHHVMGRLKALFSQEQTGGPNPIGTLFASKDDAAHGLEADKLDAGAIGSKASSSLAMGEKIKASKKPVVKLVSETPVEKLPKHAGEIMADEQTIATRKKIMGMSAILLASVAGIGIIATNGSKVDQTQAQTAAANTQTKRISSEAVLPATISTKSDGSPDLAHDVTDIKGGEVQQIQALPKAAAPAAPVASVVKEIAAVQTSKSDTSVATRDNTRRWGDGKLEAAELKRKSARRAAQRRVAKAKLQRRNQLSKNTSVNKPAITQTASLTIKPRAVRKPFVPVPDAQIMSAPQIQTQKTQPHFSDVTKDVQTKLKTLGFYQGSSTGYLDTQTKSAMHSFQDVFGLPKTDQVTTQLIAELRNANVMQPAKQQPVAASLTKLITTDTPTPKLGTNSEPAPTAKPKLEASVTPSPKPLLSPKAQEPEPAPELVVEAKRISAKSARYPGLANRRGHDENAIITVSYDIDTSGNPVNVVAVKSEGVGAFKSAFEKEAIRAASKAKFNPKTINGKPVVMKDHVTQFTFNIE